LPGFVCLGEINRPVQACGGGGASDTRNPLKCASATSRLHFGEHVHTHNLRSDYLPTFSHETQGDYFERNSGQG
jgi:hypothetical protein